MTTSPLTWKHYLAAYGVALIVMSLLDAVWLGWLIIDFYKAELGPLMADSIRVVPAALYYLAYPAGIVYLVLTPVPKSLGPATLRSALLGLTAFGVYDLTNLATLRGYSVAMTVVDMAWGTFATAVGGSITYATVFKRASAQAESAKR
jgi:uncharacterized membrane protein